MTIDHEKLVISSILRADHETQIELLPEVDSPGLFLTEKYYKIIGGMFKCFLAKVKIEPVAIAQIMEGEVTINELLEIYRYTKDAGNLRPYLNILKAEKYKRELVVISKRFDEDINSLTVASDIDEIKSQMIAKLNSITVSDKSEFVDFDFYKEKIEEQIEKSDGLQGFSWGITFIDDITSGIVIPRTYVIGGLKKSGKTRFAIHTIKELMEQQVPTAFLSLEMPAYEVTKLLSASMLKIDDCKLDGKFISNEEKLRFKHLQIEKQYFGLECKSFLKIAQVISRIRLYAKLGYKVVFIDYLQRLDHDRKRQAQELEEICIQISDAGRVNNVAIVLLSQLNNLGEREVPNVGHLKGSGGIAESVDSILLFDNLYRRTKVETDQGEIDIYFEQRYSPSGKKPIHADLGSLQFDNSTRSFGVEAKKEEGFTF